MLKSAVMLPLASTAMLAAYLIVSLAGRWNAAADLLNQFWFGGALAALICTVWFVAAGGHKTSALIIALHAALVAAALLRTAPGQHFTPPPAEASAPGAIRAVSFNAWGRNGRQALAIEMLTGLEADIIALQEVFGRSSGLADVLSDTHPFADACGLGSTRIVSRLPVLRSGCLPQGAAEPSVGVRRALRFPAVWAEIDTPDGPVMVVAVHFNWPAVQGGHASQRALLRDFIRRNRPETMLVTGDFNLADPSFMMRRMDAALAPLQRVSHGRRTWPSRPVSPVPLIGIDHAFLGSGLAAHRVAAGPHGGSDHRPLIVDFQVRDAQVRAGAQSAPDTPTAPQP